MGIRGVDGEPYVGYDPGAFYVEECSCLPRLDGHGVVVAAASIPTRRATRLVAAQPRHGHQVLRRLGHWFGRTGPRHRRSIPTHPAPPPSHQTHHLPPPPRLPPPILP